MAEQVLTQIANLAISHCGISKPIQDVNTDHSIEAQMCLTWLDTARRSVFKVIPWSFATKQVIPALVANRPTNEWLYAYQYPNDALKIIKFMSWRLNNDTRQSRIPYRVMQPVSYTLSAATPPQATPYPDMTGLWIYTNWPGVNVGLPTVIEYIFDNQNVSQWTDDFNWAFSLKLAELIVTTLTSGDPQNKKSQIMQEYGQAVSEAASNNLNEEQRPQEPQSEFIRARGGDAGYGYPGESWVATPGVFTVE